MSYFDWLRNVIGEVEGALDLFSIRALRLIPNFSFSWSLEEIFLSCSSQPRTWPGLTLTLENTWTQYLLSQGWESSSDIHLKAKPEFKSCFAYWLILQTWMNFSASSRYVFSFAWWAILSVWACEDAHWEPSKLCYGAVAMVPGVSRNGWGRVASRKESWTLSSLKTTQKKQKDVLLRDLKAASTSLLMLFVDERYVVAKAVRPVKWSSWGLFSTLGLSCLCLHEILFPSKVFLLLLFSFASRKSLATFVSLPGPVDSLRITKLSFSFFWFSDFFLCSFQEPEGFLCQPSLLPQKSLQVKTSFSFSFFWGRIREDCQSQIWVLQLSVPSFDHILFLRILSCVADIRLHPCELLSLKLCQQNL